MDVVFSGKCVRVEQQNCIAIIMDNDSGYASNNAESNSNSILETSEENIQMNTSKPIYLSEDALLEKPEISQPSTVNDSCDDNYEEYSHLFYLSDITESPSKSTGTGSQVSDTSTIITPIKPISVTEQKIDSMLKLNNKLHGNHRANDKSSSVKNDSTQSSNLEINNAYANLSDTSLIFTPCDMFEMPSTFNLCSSTTLTNESTITKLKSITNLTPHKTNISSNNVNVSPDLFSEDEAPQEIETISQMTQSQLVVKIGNENQCIKNDEKLLRRLQDGLNGVLPPPSLTLVKMTAAEMLDKINNGQEYFANKSTIHNISDLNNSESSICSDFHVQDTSSGKFTTQNKKKSLLVTTDLETCLQLHWTEVLNFRYHGLHHNRSRVSEDIEALCSKYAQRFVGAETQSTCTVFDSSNLSPSKRRAAKLRWAIKSPGRRLSHLAKRRITFSSASLQAGRSISASARQILVDSKKMEFLSRRKSPRKTPRKSPRKKIKTPSSSSKRLAARTLDLFLEETFDGAKPSTSATRVHATKRALFQSPELDKPGSSTSKQYYPSTSNTNQSPFKKKTTPKRKLFSSPRKSPRKSPYKRNLFDNKRKRNESIDELHPSKMPRTLSMSSVDSENQAPTPKFGSNGNLLKLPVHHTGELSAIHKKKLQWAVYAALKEHNIGMQHTNFKSFASTLARVTRRFLPNLSANAPRPEGGTSERMLRIARLHVFAVIKGKTVDEIIQDYLKNRQKVTKPSGYISLEQANLANKENCQTSQNKENVLQDKVNILNSKDVNTNSSLKNEAISTKGKTNRFESRVDRVRKVINFDEDGQGLR